MSTLYPDLDFTNYPGSLDNIALKANLTSASEAQLVAQIQSYIIAGKFSAATAIITANPTLQTKIFAANDYNQIRDAILALERFYKTDIYDYIQDKQTTWTSRVEQFSFKGIYSPTTQYYENNMVNYTTSTGTYLYLCWKQPATGIAPTNTNYWRLIMLKGERGVSGDGLSFAWTWDASTEYSLNDVVVYNNKWWASTQTQSGNVPQNGSNYWTEILTALPATQIPVQENEPEGQSVGDQWYKIF